MVLPVRLLLELDKSESDRSMQSGDKDAGAGRLLRFLTTLEKVRPRSGFRALSRFPYRCAGNDRNFGALLLCFPTSSYMILLMVVGKYVKEVEQ